VSIFHNPTNYSTMLARVAICTFVGGLAQLVLLGYWIPDVHQFLDWKDIKINVDALGVEGIPWLYVVFSFAFALGARIVQLHDRISDVFGIRRRFDVRDILVPLFERGLDTADAGTFATKRAEILSRMPSRRRQLMGRLFYEYASSHRSVIDEHLIHTALDRWGWYWCFVEQGVIAAICLGIYVSFGAWRGVIVTACTIGTIAGLHYLFRIATRRAASDEVDAIVRLADARAAIVEEFYALQSAR